MLLHLQFMVMAIATDFKSWGQRERDSKLSIKKKKRFHCYLRDARTILLLLWKSECYILKKN